MGFIVKEFMDEVQCGGWDVGREVYRSEKVVDGDE